MNSIIELATLKQQRQKEILERQSTKEREKALLREISRLEKTNEYLVMRSIVALSLMLVFGIITGALWT